jgi:hypothetical protein
MMKGQLSLRSVPTWGFSNLSGRHENENGDLVSHLTQMLSPVPASLLMISPCCKSEQPTKFRVRSAVRNDSNRPTHNNVALSVR